MVRIKFNDDEKVISISFSGRMDSLAVADLNERIVAHPVMQNRSQEDKLVFDLQEVDYIASTFIRTCISFAKEAAPGGFSIVNCQPFVKKTFKISGLDEVLNIT